MWRCLFAAVMFWLCARDVSAAVGDPQVATEHPYYPGELACSTFPRLFTAQAKLYQHVTGKEVTSEQDKALASWLWRNTHYWHGEPGGENLWGQGWGKGPDATSREYWGGLYGHGFALCGTTHAQWTAEMQALLGHNRGRTVGTAGHNAFEVFLTGGPYRDGKWVLLDHDLSTVVFDKQGERLLSIAEITRDWKQLTARDYVGNQACGWLPCGLHPDDGASYADYKVAEYFSGYAGPPPTIHLRRGESLRCYTQPGLDDGKTFVFWGRNYNTAGVPGPERSHTWVNQPEKMYQSKQGAGYKPGQARYGNAVYTYQPNFTSGDYKEGVIEENAEQVVFEFYTPYIIGATPSGQGAWDIYQSGGKNGLVVTGQGDVQVLLSVDQGATWQAAGNLQNAPLDATDLVKGYRQYWLKLQAGAQALADSQLRIRTVCQMNASLIPRLLPGENRLQFSAGNQAVISAGPTLAQAKSHVVAGGFNTPTVTLELAAPRGAVPTQVFAAAQMRSSNPPDPKIAYAIDYSLDRGQSWQPVVADWKITRRGDEPGDFWSQSFCYGDGALAAEKSVPVRIRFRNTGGKAIARAEAHLLYRTPASDACELTFRIASELEDSAPPRERSVRFKQGEQAAVLDAGSHPRVIWVETRPAP